MKVYFWTLFIISVATFTAEAAKTYFLSQVYRGNWYKAYHYCYTHGMKLATIKSNEELNQFIETSKNTGVTGIFWLAGVNFSKNNVFSWMGDNEPMNYTNWQTGEPNNWNNMEHCVDLADFVDWKWNDQNCDRKSKFACEKVT